MCTYTTCLFRMSQQHSVDKHLEEGWFCQMSSSSGSSVNSSTVEQCNFLWFSLSAPASLISHDKTLNVFNQNRKDTYNKQQQKTKVIKVCEDHTSHLFPSLFSIKLLLFSCLFHFCFPTLFSKFKYYPFPDVMVYHADVSRARRENNV